MLGEKIEQEMYRLQFHDIDRFIESCDDRDAKFIMYTALRKCEKALQNAKDEEEKQQVINNALLFGNYPCVKQAEKEMGIDVRWDSFVKEKVLPYLIAYETKGAYSLDEEILFPALAELPGDHRDELEDALKGLERNNYWDPLRKLLLADHTEDERLIDRYQREVSLVPERNDLLEKLQRNGMVVEKIIQQGDDRRFYSKDGFLFLAKVDGKRVVMKELLRAHTDCSRLDGLTCEERILQKLDHPNIVQYQGLLNIEGHDFILLEYIDAQNKPDSEEFVLEELRQMADAYNHMQQQGILYLDFKSKNILYDGERCKLVDFGWAQFRKEKNYTALSTPRYMAPEVLLTCKANEKSDILGLGIYLYERLTGKHPFTDIYIPQHVELASLLHFSVANTLGEYRNEMCLKNRRFQEVIEGMLEKDVGKRLGWDELRCF